MGHPSGKIADIEFEGAPDQTIYGFERDGRIYVRRRITFHPDVLRRERLLNIAFWLDNPPLADWRHGSGLLSCAYLALTTPVLSSLLAPAAVRKRLSGSSVDQRWRHMFNCLRDPIRTLTSSATFLYRRYMVKPRLPGFFAYSVANRYALHYHAEQAPNPNSVVMLADEVDALGVRKACIDLQWSEQDIDSVIRAHEILDAELQKQKIGRLSYRYPLQELREAIRHQAFDGFHQVGTLRMAKSPQNGATSPFGQLFGAPNVYVASSATFPTSGQANPTLALVALAIRQARKIASSLQGQANVHA
jgi:hypothetical protein